MRLSRPNEKVHVGRWMLYVSEAAQKLIFVRYVKYTIWSLFVPVGGGAWISDYAPNLVETQMLQNIFRCARSLSARPRRRHVVNYR